MLYIIGFGLYSYKDITLRGLEAVRNSRKIYLEGYTSVHGTHIQDFEKVIGKNIYFTDREMVEQTDRIVDEAEREDVSLLVVGTPLFATTHADIIIRCKNRGIRTEVIHNASILNVFGCCGLYSYGFGRVVSIPYFTDKWRPTSFYDNIIKNYMNGLHTLCLLDIKTEEERFMSANEALHQILEAASITNSDVVNEDTRIFVICRFGSPTEMFTYERIRNAMSMSHGEPLHSLIIPAELDIIEEELVNALLKKI